MFRAQKKLDFRMNRMTEVVNLSMRHASMGH